MTRDTQRQKLGNAGIMSRSVAGYFMLCFCNYIILPRSSFNQRFLTFIFRAKAKRKKRDIESIKLKPVIQLDIGIAREAAWDNVLCRHIDTAPVTTWTTRKQALGTHRVRSIVFFASLL